MTAPGLPAEATEALSALTITDFAWRLAGTGELPDGARGDAEAIVWARQEILTGAAEAAAPALRAQSFPRCPTECDTDCAVPCHEVHQMPWKRDHNPEVCVATIVSAATAAERARVFVAIRHALSLDLPWRGEALDLISAAIQEASGD